MKAVRDKLTAALNANPRAVSTLIEEALVLLTPVPMILHCPKCGLQHIDEPEEERTEHVCEGSEVVDSVIVGWDNPPHRSHLCHGCGTIWRPADVETTGVASIETRGEADNFAAQTNAQFEVTRDALRWQGFVKSCTSDDESFVDMLEEADPETPEEMNAVMDRWLAQQQ